MTQKRLNIKEFAELLGVSTATVSRAFSDSGRISEKTRQQIIAKAEEVGYRANIHASNLAGCRSNVISFFYPSIGYEQPDYFIIEIQLGLHGALQQSQLLLQTHPLPPGPNQKATLNIYRDYILSGGPAGMVIVAGSPDSIELVEIARSAGIPYIVVGHMSIEPKYTITFDNAEGALMAARYFVKTGRSHPAYVGGYLDKRKIKGFTAGLEALGDRLVLGSGGYTFNHGALAFRDLMRNHPETDCVLCANDVIAAGLMREAHEHGVKVPEKLAVIGFDDARFSRYLTPALSTVSLNMQQMGIRAIELLKQQFKGQEINAEYINCDLIIRESC